jgi:hypothetical protein
MLKNVWSFTSTTPLHHPIRGHVKGKIVPVLNEVPLNEYGFIAYLNTTP